MRKIQLDIVAISQSVTQSHNYAVVLGEKGGVRRLPIVIGSFEAQAIAVAMQNMTPSRPLTHDLFKNALETFNIELKEIIINNLLDGIFYAKLVCIKDGEILEVDSRTSDALALSVRFKCPIYTYEFILDAAGVALEQDMEDYPDIFEQEEAEGEEEPNEDTALSSYSLSELHKLLADVLADEDYERAAEIRDEINRRKSEQ